MTDEQIYQVFLKALEKKIYIDVYPIDSWDSWSYRIYLEDAMAPFFESYRSDSEFQTYMGALKHAVSFILDTLGELCKS